MKEVFHVCMSSHDEVLFRSPEDHYMFINLSGLEAFRSDTEILVTADMSTHWHHGVFSADPMRYASGLRMAYTRYYNRKYGRRGRIGEINMFISKVRGFNHQIVLFNYILRNGLHHAASATSLGYEFCSSREVFRQELGFSSPEPVFTSRRDVASFFPRHAEFPDHFVLDRNGTLIRDCFMEIRRVEHLYSTPRNYLYQMNRLTDDSWSMEQMQDRTGPPLTLAGVEVGYDSSSIARFLKNEKGWNAGNRMDDLSLCRLIDVDYLARSSQSVYHISEDRKRAIAKELIQEYNLPEKQVRRCLIL